MSQPLSARWLAPLALFGALVAVIVTIAAAGGSSDGGTVGAGSAPAATPTARTSTHRTTTARKPATTARSYTVQPGDVLGAIADKTGVPLSRIEQLNPTVDAQSLHAGQQLKLAP